VSVFPETVAKNSLFSKGSRKSAFYTKVVRRGDDHAIIAFLVHYFHVFRNALLVSDLGQVVERAGDRRRREEVATHVLLVHV